VRRREAAEAPASGSQPVWRRGFGVIGHGSMFAEPLGLDDRTSRLGDSQHVTEVDPSDLAACSNLS